MTLSTRLTVLFIVIMPWGAAVGHQHDQDLRTQKLCVIMPSERHAEIMLLVIQAKTDVGWEDERHLHRAMDKLDRVEMLLSFTNGADVCPAGSPAAK